MERVEAAELIFFRESLATPFCQFEPIDHRIITVTFKFIVTAVVVLSARGSESNGVLHHGRKVDFDLIVDFSGSAAPDDRPDKVNGSSRIPTHSRIAPIPPAEIANPCIPLGRVYFFLNPHYPEAE